MARTGRPVLPYARRHGAFVRFSETEWGALKRALEAEHPIAARRPTLPEWLRDLAVAHATQVLQVEVRRGSIRHLSGGAPDWKRWRIAPAVRKAASRL